MVKVHFKTFGCPTNFSESESMSALLKKANFELVDNPEDAFVLIFNICTVKGNIVPIKEIRTAREKYEHKKIIVAGCITADIVPEIKEIDPEASIINTHNIDDIVSVVEETINDNPIDVLAEPEEPQEKINLPRLRNRKSIEIMPICEGCNGNCSYCSVRIVKGKLKSYPKEKIIEQCKKAVFQGAKEIWITAQDTASYMLDKQKKTDLPSLIEEITKIPGNFKIRIGMMNPNNLIPVIDDIIKVLNNEKVFKFIHIPIQSGSNEILAAMRRKYTVREFKDAVKKLKADVPNLTLSTDMICGFPGETKEQFQESVQLIDEIKPDIVNANRFRIRPGTESAEMDNQILGGESKDRCKQLISMFEWSAFLINKKWLGWTGEVILDEIGKEGTDTIIGRNLSYKPIIIDNKENNLKIGDIKKIKITNYSKHDLKGELI